MGAGWIGRGGGWNVWDVWDGSRVLTLQGRSDRIYMYMLMTCRTWLWDSESIFVLVLDASVLLWKAQLGCVVKSEARKIDMFCWSIEVTDFVYLGD